MSAVGTTLLQSPGSNEGKARYETLGIHEPKVISSSVGAALTARALKHLSWDCAAPTGLNKCISIPNPGLAPWAMKSVALTGLLYVFSINTLYYFDALALTCESLEHKDTRLRAHIK